MKFFGWGRKKDTPPIQPARDQGLQNSDASLRSPGAAEHGLRQKDRPQITPSESKVALHLPAKEYIFGDAVVDLESGTWEERLQETIRFVFSHEQEGLLAIGTFAVDQLAGVTHTDGRQKPPPAPAPDHNVVNSVNSHVKLLIREVPSSDDEIESMPSRNESYPVFGDHDASNCRSLSARNPKPAIAKPLPACTSPPSATAPPDADPSPEDFSSPGVCGLFASRSRRAQKDGARTEPRKKPPESKRLWRLWRSGSSVSAKVSPEMKPPAESQPQGLPFIANVVAEGGAGAPGAPKPCPASEVGEQRKRRCHSFGKGWACAHNVGNWIRTDSEFVVLEM